MWTQIEIKLSSFSIVNKRIINLGNHCHFLSSRFLILKMLQLLRVVCVGQLMEFSAGCTGHVRILSGLIWFSALRSFCHFLVVL